MLKLKLRKFNKIKKTFWFIVKQKNSDRYLFYSTKKDKNVDFFHFFNTLNLHAKLPWGVTFETLVPCFEPYIDFHKGNHIRGNKQKTKNVKKYLKALSNEKCKFLIAISESTYNIQVSLLDHFPKYRKMILHKMIVLHPPQELIATKSDLENKPDTTVVNFMFVGRDFFRKGGVEVVNVFRAIECTYPNFHIDIIGDLDDKLFLSENMPKKEKEDTITFFKTKQKRFTFYKSIDNKELLERMVSRIHVGLLPTKTDTYGYSVLEFQAAGCPVITANSRALKEINNADCGWLIDVKQNEFGETFHFNKEGSDDLKIEIESQLKSIIIDILENPKTIYKKSINSLDRIKNEHSLEEYSKKIENIYNTIVAT
jgi:glycosyltransferase involved in cell wall biosynthesis